MGLQKKSALYYYKTPRESELLRLFKEASSAYPAIKPEGYSKKEDKKPVKRILTALWSDMHYGTDLQQDEHLRPYGNTEESRRTAKIVSNILDYKRDKRTETQLHLDFNGDDFAGMLGHDDRKHAELTAQIFRTAHLEAQIVSRCATEFPSVRVHRGYGNHGRNTLRHHGRADNTKWENFELLAFQLVRGLCRDLKNVVWAVNKRPTMTIPMFSWKKFMTHGDTVLGGKPGSPQFERQLSGVNSSPYYRGPYDVVELGHWHQLMHFSVGSSRVIVNPALIPPDGFSESNGYLNECGQVLYETTERYPVGDFRAVIVGPEDDHNSKLDALISPWTEHLVFTDAE